MSGTGIERINNYLSALLTLHLLQSENVL